jgi:hypothetical protein
MEVFVDDFVGTTNKLDTPHLLRISRSMLHGVHAIFPPNEVTNHPGGDSIAEQKIDKGEGKWEHKKEILGWMFDGEEFTIQLPKPKCDKILTLIKKLSKLKQIPLKRFQELAGKLQHASMGIPGGAGLFSPLQMAMLGNPAHIFTSRYLLEALKDWRLIIQHMKANPTSVLQLVTDFPNFVGFSDACKLGAGGVWSPGIDACEYTVWQLEWPEDIQQRLVSTSNHAGDISINDLELAGIIINFIVLEIISPTLKHKHVGTYCDNTSAVSWANKLRTSKSIPAARLLRLLGLRLLASKASSLTTLSIPGDNNQMADVSSRAFKNGEYFLNKQTLSNYFNVSFPLPKPHSWKELKIPSKLSSRVMSCVRGELSTMESLLKLPKAVLNIGNSGKATQRRGTEMPSCPMPHQFKEASSSQPLLRGSGQASTVEELKSEFRQSQRPSRPSQRPSNWQDN